jgi:hypothetical protein
MNKIVTGITGLMPFYQEDIEFLQNAMLEMGKALASVWGDNFILSGCVYTETDTESYYTEGFVVANGEVLFFPKQKTVSFLEPQENLLVKINDSLSEEREFEIADSTGVKNHKIWNFRTAVLPTANEIGSEYVYEMKTSAKSSFQNIVNKIKLIESPTLILNVASTEDYDIKLYKGLSNNIFGTITLREPKTYTLTFGIPSMYITDIGTTILFENNDGYVKLRKTINGVNNLVINYAASGKEYPLIIPVNYTI